MGGLVKALLQLLKGGVRRPPVRPMPPRPTTPPAKPPSKPQQAQQKAEQQGSASQQRDNCNGNCAPKKPKPQKRDTKPYADRLRGKRYEEAEDILDRELRDDAGWTKAPLGKGDGVRYYDGKGGSVSLNRGYPEGLKGGGGDAVHKGPYVKVQPSGDRVPLGE